MSAGLGGRFLDGSLWLSGASTLPANAFQMSADSSLNARSKIHPNDASIRMAVSDGCLQFPGILENPRKRLPVRQWSRYPRLFQAEFAGIGGKVQHPAQDLWI